MSIFTIYMFSLFICHKFYVEIVQSSIYLRSWWWVLDESQIWSWYQLELYILDTSVNRVINIFPYTNVSPYVAFKQCYLIIVIVNMVSFSFLRQSLQYT
jgi:hypothetical protein